MININHIVGTHDILFITFDTLSPYTEDKISIRKGRFCQVTRPGIPGETAIKQTNH